MTLLAATALGLALGVLGSPPAVDVALGSRGEIGGGYIPVTALEPATLALQSTLDARVGLRLLSPRRTLVLQAGPRLLFLLPNIAELDRPLVFSTASGSYLSQVTRRLTFSLGANAGLGELSYAALAQTFVPGTGAIDASVIPLFLASGEARAAWQASRVHLLGLALRASAQDTLEEPEDPEEPGVIPTFETLGGELSSGHSLSAVDTLTYRAGFEAFLSERDGDFYTTRSSLAWLHRYDTGASWGASLGGEWVHSSVDSEDYLLPNGALEHHAEGGSRERRWALRASAGVRGFFDRLNFIYLPQAFTQANLEVRWEPRFRSILSLFGSTSITEREALPEIFETFLGLDLLNRYQLSPTLDLLFGVRSALRGPHVSVFDTNVQGQLLVFSGFDWSDGTDRDRGRFMR